MEPNAPQPQMTYVQRAEALVQHFASLTTYARKLAFPPLREASHAPIVQPGWSRGRKMCFTLMHPVALAFEANKAEWLSLLLSFWYIVLILWINSALLILGVSPITRTTTAPTTTSTSTISGWLSFLFLLLILGFLLLVVAIIPITYWSWLDFWRDQRYKRTWRILSTLIFIALVGGFTHKLLWPHLPSALKTALWYMAPDTIRFLLAYAGFLLPTATVLYRLGGEVLVWGIRVFVILPVQYFQSAHHPLSKDTILKLAQEAIPLNTEEKLHWKLADISREELQILRALSEANREATDKRLIPAALIFGIIGVFGNTKTFSNAVDGVFAAVNRTLSQTQMSWEAIIQSVLVGLSLAVIFSFVGLLLTLFANLITQSLVIEACIVAEYARGPETRTAQVPPSSATRQELPKWLRWSWRQ